MSLHEGSNSPTYPIDLNGADGIGTTGALPGEQWQPEIAVSPSGTQLFVGCYDMPNSDGNIYTRGDLASVSPLGTISWNSTTVISGPFLPPSTTDAYDTFTGEVNMGDYQSATADENNFYYSYTKTSPLPYTYNGVTTTYQQEDVYLATIPIPYPSAAPASPTDPVFHPPVAETSSPAMLTWAYSGDGSVTVYAEYSVAGGGWVTAGSASASAGSITLSSNFTYDPSKTYYFRLRARYSGGTDAPPAYSPVIQSWSSGTPRITTAVVDLTSKWQPDPNQQVFQYSYLLHLSLAWTGASAQYSNVFVQFRATATDPWIDLPTSSDLLTSTGGDVYISRDSALENLGQVRVQLCNLSAGGAGLGGGLSDYTNAVTPVFDDPTSPAQPVITNAYSSSGYLTVTYNYWAYQLNDTITLYGWDTTGFSGGSEGNTPEWNYLASCDGTQGTLNAWLTAGDEYELYLTVQRVLQDSYGNTFTRTVQSGFTTLTA